MLLILQPLIKTEVRRFDHFMAWMDRTGWSRLEHLLMVALACLAILWSVKLVSRAVRRAGRERMYPAWNAPTPRTRTR